MIKLKHDNNKIDGQRDNLFLDLKCIQKFFSNVIIENIVATNYEQVKKYSSIVADIKLKWVKYSLIIHPAIISNI